MFPFQSPLPHSPQSRRSTLATVAKKTRRQAAMPSSSPSFLKTLTPSRLHNTLLLLSLIFIVYLLFFNRNRPADVDLDPGPLHLSTPLTARRHILFAIASSSASFPRRHPYLRLWYSPNSTRAVAFLDSPPELDAEDGYPPTVISEDTSRFPYTFQGGLRSAIRVARIVKEIVDRGEQDVRWYVFGDDDTVFFVDNLVKLLSKYDHDRWYYIGSNSENYEQNFKYSFDMAFGGGGFAISASLATVLAKVLDSCLIRYAHLYGSDARIFSCVAELGIGLTHEPGFHQIDMRGNLFGFLTAHPLSPLVSLHHLDALDPIFPLLNKTQSLVHLFKAVNVDPGRILQQTVCYDQTNSLTVSVSWGYAIQVFEGNELLPDLLSVQKTFIPWRRSRSAESHYMFNLRESPRDLCKRPLTFFLDSVLSDDNGVQTVYTRFNVDKCTRKGSVKILKKIMVFSRKLELNIGQLKAPRRQCCDVLPIINGTMVIHIRKCGAAELISMHRQ